MHWFRVEHFSALPPGRCYIYSVSELGLAVYNALQKVRPDISVLGFFDTRRSDGISGICVKKYCKVDHLHENYDYLIIAHASKWQEILYENVRDSPKPLYVALEQCLKTEAPKKLMFDAYACLAEKDFMPQAICLQICSRCNIQCTMCPLDRPVVKNTFMPMELITKAIDEAETFSAQTPVYLSTGYGEPLLHQNLEEIISVVARKGLIPIVATNGILLTQDRLRGMLEAGLGQLCISYSGYNRSSYERVYANTHFDDVVKNIQGAWKLINSEYPNATVYHIGCIIPTDKEDFFSQAYKTYDFLSSLEVNPSTINFGVPQNRGNLIHIAPYRNDRDMHSMLSSFPPLVKPCHALNSIGVSADGDVEICYCSSRTSKDVHLGNLYNKTLSELAMSPKRIAIFKEFKDMKFSKDSICVQCDVPYLI